MKKCLGLCLIAMFVGCGSKTPPAQVEYTAEATEPAATADAPETTETEVEEHQAGEVLFPDAEKSDRSIRISSSEPGETEEASGESNLPQPTKKQRSCRRNSDCAVYNYLENCCPGCGSGKAARKTYVKNLDMFCRTNKPLECPEKKCKAVRSRAKCEQKVCVVETFLN